MFLLIAPTQDPSGHVGGDCNPCNNEFCGEIISSETSTIETTWKQVSECLKGRDMAEKHSAPAATCNFSSRMSSEQLCL